MLDKDILIVDDDARRCNLVQEMLRSEGYSTRIALSGIDALNILKNVYLRLVLLGFHRPGLSGLDLYKKIKEISPYTLVIFIVGQNQKGYILDAIKTGVYDYITKPIDDIRLKTIINRALEQQKLITSCSSLKQCLGPWDLQSSLIFRDQRMEQVLEMAQTIAETGTTVQITGQKGVGKCLLAWYIHEKSSRRHYPFAKISCGGVPDTLLERELFGYVRRAFPGASHDRIGKFEEVRGGTIFLGDINSASPNLQKKLLRVLAEGSIKPVGSSTRIPVDVRTILGVKTSQPDAAADDKFMETIYNKISLVSLHIPTLRERQSDIAPLIERFIKQFNQMHKKNIRGISKNALEPLLSFNWPGNIRELANVIEQAVILSPGGYIVSESLPPYIRGLSVMPSFHELALDEALFQVEKHIIFEALERSNWNREDCARALGITRATLFNKMRRFKLTGPRQYPSLSKATVAFPHEISQNLS